MYNKDYNISLKKKGGSQLASGGKGETILNISCCFRILRKTRILKDKIDKIMKQIEENFAKISTKYSKTALEKLSKDKKNLSSTDKKAVSDFICSKCSQRIEQRDTR